MKKASESNLEYLQLIPCPIYRDEQTELTKLGLNEIYDGDKIT